MLNCIVRYGAAFFNGISIRESTCLFNFFHIDNQILILFPKHYVLQGNQGRCKIVLRHNQIIFHICKVSLSLDKVGIAFLSKFLLTTDEFKGILQCTDLPLNDNRKFCVIDDIVEGLHRSKADFIPELLLLLNAHHERSLGNLHIVDSLEAVEEDDSGRNGIAIIE